MQSISVILCTRNRAGILPRAVKSIFEASRALPNYNVELIIIDNGSSDSTLEVATSLSCDSPIPVKIIQEPNPGVCRSKNIGIANSTGSILFFTDDDCVVSKNHFVDLVKHFGDDRSPRLLGGRVTLGDPNDLPFTIKIDDDESTYGGAQHPGGFIHGCNLSMARSTIEAMGGFDEDFGPGAPLAAAEDTEMVYRAYRSGIPVGYVPDMAVAHFHGRRTVKSISRLNHSYHVGNGGLHAKAGLSDRIFLRHLYWNSRNFIREWFGGSKFDSAVGLSHGALVYSQLKGIWKFFKLRVRRRFNM